MGISPAIAQKLREKAERHRELSELIEDPEIASDHKRFPAILRERGQLEDVVALARELDGIEARRLDAEEVLADEDADPELAELAREELESIQEELTHLDEKVKSALVSDEELLREKVIVEIRAAAGGDEASLFAGDLHRMYMRFAEQRNWKIELLEAKATEVGGFKEIIFGVRGVGAWNLFRFESGGHRVQRVPETESQGRIHTSAATVAVLPEAEEVDLVVRNEDLRIDTMRASGAGGQHVNKTESAVRITHIPTGTVVVCMDEKSQHKNKAQAMRILRTRIFDAERRRLHEERASQRRDQVGSGDRSERIRTYNFPQNRVSDHRLGENYSLEQVMAGKLEPILAALEELDREERIKAL